MTFSFLKKGSSGPQVRMLQMLLTHSTLGRNALLVDGQFGNQTHQALIAFQEKSGLVPDGIYGRMSASKLVPLTDERFMFSVHAGHGGWINGEYATHPSTGKRYFHEGQQFHKGGWFYEGIENRIIADAVAEGLRKLGVFVLVTHTDYCDDGYLGQHYVKTLPYIQAGYKGYTHAFHSNAAPTKVKDKAGKVIRRRTQAELDQIQGGFVFTTTGSTFSDKIAPIELRQWQPRFGKWVRLRGSSSVPNESSDAEANFKVLRDIEEAAKNVNSFFGAILSEFGFMTSLPDCLFITSPKVRAMRIQAAIDTALEVRRMFYK